MRAEERKIVAVVLLLLNLCKLFPFIYISRIFFVFRIPLLVKLVVVKYKSRLGDNIRSKLLDLVHADSLFEFEVDGVLLIISHKAFGCHQADVTLT